MDGSNLLPEDGWHFHPPGAPSRKAVLDIGLKCPHSCLHCFYVYMDGNSDPHHGMRHAKFHSVEWLKQVLDEYKKTGFINSDITGGEPSAHPGIVEVVQHATDIGMPLRMITLGQFFARNNFDLLKRLLKAGLTDINFSTHAATEELFKEMTGESLAKQELARTYLDDIGFRYSSNATISNKNYKTIPDIARLFASHSGTYVVNLLHFMPRYQWQQHAPEVEAKFSEVYPYLKEAVEILTDRGIAVNIRYAPMCQVKGLEKHLVGFVGVRYDPSEWMSSQTHYEDDTRPPVEVARRLPITPGQPTEFPLTMTHGMVGDVEVIAVRGNPQAPTTLFPKKCEGCSAMAVCDGLDANYLGRHGSDELTPYEGKPRGILLDQERLAYEPAFKIKIQPWAK